MESIRVFFFRGKTGGGFKHFFLFPPHLGTWEDDPIWLIFYSSFSEGGGEADRGRQGVILMWLIFLKGLKSPTMIINICKNVYTYNILLFMTGKKSLGNARVFVWEGPGLTHLLPSKNGTLFQGGSRCTCIYIYIPLIFCIIIYRYLSHRINGWYITYIYRKNRLNVGKYVIHTLMLLWVKK